MTAIQKCPICSREHPEGSEQAACIDLYGECPLCCAAHQIAVDAFRLQAHALTQRPPVVTNTIQERVFRVRVKSSRPIAELSAHIENRLWSLDKVLEVAASEVGVKP